MVTYRSRVIGVQSNRDIMEKCGGSTALYQSLEYRSVSALTVDLTGYIRPWNHLRIPTKVIVSDFYPQKSLKLCMFDHFR